MVLITVDLLGRCKLKEFLKRQLGHLLFGIIVLLPVAVIAVMGVWAFRSIDKAGQSVLGIFSFGKPLPFGLGFLTIILLIYFSGILLRKTRIRQLTAKIPVLGGLLGGDGTGKTIGIERLLGLQPCVFLYSPTCLSYGFILSEESVTLNGEEMPSQQLLNVYFPNAPTLVMGQVFPARKETVIRLGNSAAEIVSLLLYASRSPKHIKYLPWKEETGEEFKERAKRFGLG